MTANPLLMILRTYLIENVEQNPLVRSAALLSLIYLCAWLDVLSTEAVDGLSGGMISVV